MLFYMNLCVWGMRFISVISSVSFVYVCVILYMFVQVYMCEVSVCIQKFKSEHGVCVCVCVCVCVRACMRERECVCVITNLLLKNLDLFFLLPSFLCRHHCYTRY